MRPLTRLLAAPATRAVVLIAWFVPGYVLTYHLGVELYFKSASATTLWLTNGFVLASLLIMPRRWWPLLLCAGILTHLQLNYNDHHVRTWWGLQTALLDNGEALLCAGFAQKWISGDFDISRLKDTLSLVVAIFFGTALIALIAAVVLCGTVFGAEYWKSWRLWWYGDFTGDIVLAPLMVAWLQARREDFLPVNTDRLGEAIILGILTVAVTFLTFNGTGDRLPANWLLPVLLWASLRFHPRIVLLLLMISTVLAVNASIHGSGPFVSGDQPVIDTVIALQAYIAVLAVSMLVVSSLTCDRNRVLKLHVDAETGMRVLNNELEERVSERTSQYEAANAELRNEMKVRTDTESMLRTRNEELRAFAYTVSHDLKAPLRGIAGYAQEMERKHATGLTERALFCLTQIRTATQSLDTLIEELLRYSRFDAESPTFTSIDLEELVNRLLAERAPETEKRGVAIFIELEVRNIVVWERGLTHSLANLIDNAVKYTRQSDAPSIRITAKRIDSAVQICVADNGIGFDMKYHDRLYGLFNRLVHQDEFEGTGAGLAIAKKLTEKSGSRLWATSEPGNGATFTIEVPTRNDGQ